MTEMLACWFYLIICMCIHIYISIYSHQLTKTMISNNICMVSCSFKRALALWLSRVARITRAGVGFWVKVGPFRDALECQGIRKWMLKHLPRPENPHKSTKRNGCDIYPADRFGGANVGGDLGEPKMASKVGKIVPKVAKMNSREWTQGWPKAGFRNTREASDSKREPEWMHRHEDCSPGLRWQESARWENRNQIFTPLKKKAGRRPALKNAREASDSKRESGFIHRHEDCSPGRRWQESARWENRNTTSTPLKKKAGRRPASKTQVKHQTAKENQGSYYFLICFIFSWPICFTFLFTLSGFLERSLLRG